MSSIIKIHPALTDSTSLYRTLDFFSAAAIVKNHQLMFSRADTFSDKNEGIDHLLAQLELLAPHGGCRIGWHDSETAREYHEKVKRSHYISCWSQTAESVAMWSLYSPDHSSVRVSTTISKLKPAIEALLSKYSIGRFTENDLGNSVVFSVEGHIAPVEYASLSWVVRRLARRVKAHHRIVSRYAKKNKPIPPWTQLDSRYYQREKNRRLIEVGTTCRLKDISFQHEGEVRLSVRLGEEPCSSKLLEYRSLLNPSHPYHEVLEFLKMTGFVIAKSLPPREFAQCPSNLIDTVAIDPRCPPHKAEFMRNWFITQGVAVVESESFGYIPDLFDLKSVLGP